MSVGWRFTKAFLRELNSEYRLRTSKSYNPSQSKLIRPVVKLAYACPYRVHYETTSTLVTLARLRNHNLQIWVLIKYLFYATIVASLLSWRIPVPRGVFLVIIVAEAGDELRRLIGRRGMI